MFRFFRNIRQQLLAENKTVRYMKYAVGEILLIVVGILIALQLNNWNEDRGLKQRETSILNEIKGNIESNIVEIERDIIEISERITSLDVVLEVIDKDLPFNESLVPHFAKINGYRYFNKVATGYQILKSEGADIIPQDQLRFDLVDHFDIDLVRVETTMIELKDHYHNYILDYFRLHFEFESLESFWGGAAPKPKDFASLKNDASFKSSLQLFRSVQSSTRILLERGKENSEEILVKLRDYLESNGK